MQPFIDDGKLLSRSYEELSQVINDFVVIEEDGQIIACAGLRLYENDNAGEIYALAVKKTFHNTGVSSKLMELLLQKAIKLKLSSIFALSKYGGRFFLRYGFSEVGLSTLPSIRQKSYDNNRKSIIYFKNL